MPWSSVIGYAPTKKEYVVSWWHAEAQADGSLKPGVVKWVVVTL